MPRGLEFLACHFDHNLSTLTWTKKTILEEGRERTRQGKEGTLAGECPGEWYMRHVHLYEKGCICATWLRICHVGYNFVSTYTWTKKTVLEEGRERTRQGEYSNRNAR